MGGALLRSGSIRDYHALGAVGNPVFSAANQLREAMRRQLGQGVADLFAIPKLSEDGTSVDWYAPVNGTVVPWSSATSDEQNVAREALLSARANLAERSAALQSESDTERQIFGTLLAQATAIPSESHVYLVDGRPVMTFWGFTESDAPPGRDIIGQLGVRAAADTPAAADNAKVEESRRDLPWWLWLLLLLLLLLLALWLLRACSPDSTAPTDGTPPPGDTHRIEGESTRETQRLDSARHSTGAGIRVEEIRDVAPDSRTATGVADGETETGTEPVLEDASNDGAPTPAIGDEAQPPTDESAADDEGNVQGESPEEMPSTESPEDAAGAPLTEESPESPAADDASSPSEAPDDAPLTIPPSAVGSGSTEFLDGRWQSETGLQDADTGAPVSLDYNFDGGEGTVTLSHGAGDARQACTGAATSSMENDKLLIDHGAITCPDGSTFERSRVECAVGDGGRAKCKGINEDRSTYDVRIGR